MDKKTQNFLLAFSSLALEVAGLLFIILSIAGEGRTLPHGLACICLGNLFNLVRLQYGKKTEDKKP